MRSVRSIFLALLLPAVVSVSVPALAREGGPSEAERWGRYPESLQEVLERFPVVEANPAALEIERLAALIGIDIAPRPMKDRERPTAEAREAFDAAKRRFESYLDGELQRPTAGANAPTDDVAEYLTRRRDELRAVRDRLIHGEPPRWERDLTKFSGMVIPNLLGHLDLQKLLLADALAASSAGERARMLADLDASWSLNASLRDDPVVITQLIAIAVTRLQAGVLRHVAQLPDAWRERLFEHDYRDSLMEALRLEGWMWTQTSELPEPHPPQDGFWERVGRTVSRPYVRMCLDDSADVWLGLLARVAATPTLCEADFDALNRSLLESVSWWNRLGKVTMPNLLETLPRLARLELDLELTDKVLALDAAERDAGALVRAPREIETSSACPASRWIVTRQGDGALSITLDPPIAWRNAIGVVLPTRWSSR